MEATTTAQVIPQRARVTGYPADSLRFDWAFVVLGFLLISGLMVDGWAHFHNQVDDSFFTPWHFLFYSAFGFVALFLGFHQFRNMQKGHDFKKALPQGYWLSLIGANTFALGGVGDMIWHTLFGIEGGTEALLSPTHLMLAIGMGLIVTGPLRAAWRRAGTSKSWAALGPAILGAALFLVLAAFITSYAHPFIDPVATYSSSQNTEPEPPIEDLYVMNLDGTGQTRLTNGSNRGAASASWSPDGTKIVYSRGEPNETDLYVMNVDGSDSVQLSDLPGAEFGPAWSLDGSTIAFVNLQSESSDVYTIQADGSDLVQVTDTPSQEFSPAWSPDGTQIMYSQQNGESFSIIVANADGSEAAVFGEGSGFGSAWSPDGTKIAYATRIDDNFDIYLADADGSNITRITTDPEFDAFPSWMPDGQQLVFESWREGHAEIYTVPISGESHDTPVVNLTNNPAFNSTSGKVSPDGSRILYSAAAAIQPVESDAQDAGVTAIILQSAFVAGVVLLLVRHWSLPFGATTLVLTLSTLAMAILSDMFMLLPAALIAGLIGDVLIWRLNPSANTRILSVIAFVVPALLFALYMLTLQLAGGITWSIHVWTGAIFLAGLVGLLLNALADASKSASQPSLVSS